MSDDRAYPFRMGTEETATERMRQRFREWRESEANNPAPLWIADAIWEAALECEIPAFTYGHARAAAAAVALAAREQR